MRQIFIGKNHRMGWGGAKPPFAGWGWVRLFPRTTRRGGAHPWYQSQFDIWHDRIELMHWSLRIDFCSWAWGRILQRVVSSTRDPLFVKYLLVVMPLLSRLNEVHWWSIFPDQLERNCSAMKPHCVNNGIYFTKKIQWIFHFINFILGMFMIRM